MSEVTQNGFEAIRRGERADARSAADQEPCKEKERPWDRRRARRLFRTYAETKDPSIRNQIAECYLNMARFYAWKYTGRGVDHEELYQEACLGLLRAIEGFDPSRGVEFHTYAIWFVEGCVRQYFCDKAWVCKVPRSVKGMSLQIKGLSDELGRFPSKEEIAEFCDIPPDRIVDAVAAAQSWSSISLDRSRADGGVISIIARETAYVDKELESVENRLSIEDAAQKTLDPSEAEIVRMYYYDELSQREIASRCGTYQMMISRSLQKSASKMGAALSGRGKLAC